MPEVGMAAANCYHCQNGYLILPGQKCARCGAWRCMSADCLAHYAASVTSFQTMTEDQNLVRVCRQHRGFKCENRLCETYVTVLALRPGGCVACIARCPQCGAYYPAILRHICPAPPPGTGRFRGLDTGPNAFRLGEEFRIEGEVRIPDRRPLIMNYTYKPPPVFHGRSRDNLFFGIEQELEALPGHHPNGIAQIVRDCDTANAWYCKNDSSMYNGVELVSHPMTFSSFPNLYTQEMADAIAEIASNNWEGLYTTGIHVHVSRDAFTGYHLFKFVQFFLSNPDFIRFIAGRDEWCDDARRGRHKIAAYEKDALVTDPESDRRGRQGRIVTPTGDVIYSADAALRELAFAGKQRKYPWQPSTNRYVAVNLQNRTTVEVRVFRSTVKLERLRGYIQFMHAAYYFTKGAKWHVKDPAKGLSEVGFRQYIDKFPNRYADLLKIISQEGVWAQA